MPARRAAAGAVAGMWALAAAYGAVPTAIASAAVNPLANPAANRPLPFLADNTGTCTYAQNGKLDCPSPCFPHGTFDYNPSKSCTDLLLTAINQAQAAEHLKGFALPSDYFGLPATDQMLVLINLERISRSVPPLVGVSPYLDPPAATAALHGEDPAFQPSFGPVHVWSPPEGGLYAFGGTWAGNSVNAAAAVFSWFYDDGWGGPKGTWNFACTSPTAPGCWGHRDELLGRGTGVSCTDCISGTGYASPSLNGWRESYAFLLVRPVQFPTPLAWTWDGDVLPYLPPGWERVHAP